MPLATGCFNFGTGSDKGKYKTEELAAAWLWATAGSKEEVNPYTTTTDPETVSTGGAVTTYKTGTQFYNGIVNDSTDLITNESGDAIAQYAYEPFGRIVPEASDLDLDGDGKSYTGGFLYTGQEWELETDVYNFHARTYDAQTGRFMQNDPVFTDRVGYDSYDTYQYVNENPVNFVDPSGESWLSNATKGKWVSNLAQTLMFGAPTTALGLAATGLNVGLGAVKSAINGGPGPKMYYRDGAIITEGGLIGSGGGLSLGGFINVSTDADEATIRHELAHHRQYNEQGEIGYLSRTWMSPFVNGNVVGFSGKKLWAENNADMRAGTNSYGRNPYYLMMALVLANQPGSTTRQFLGSFLSNIALLPYKMNNLYELEKNKSLYFFQYLNPDFNVVNYLNGGFTCTDVLFGAKNQNGLNNYAYCTSISGG